MSSPSGQAVDVAAGPVLSFGFNLHKVPGQGEDADPIVRDGPDLGLVGVFDGMGGAGGTVYETPDGPRSGAYIASRIARDVVEDRLVDLLEPNWTLKGTAAADDLQRSVRQALQEALGGLNAPQSRLKSRLLRALPTTMAVVALQRATRGGPRWNGHVFWAGDSRAYVIEAAGLRQLSTDDLRDRGDAMDNLRRDSVVSNAMSADTDFAVRHRRVELQAPFLLVCATDGCFGYLPTPMHFERLLLKNLASARSVDGWSKAVQTDIAAVAGDDAAMAVLGVGADLRTFQQVLAPRLAALEREVVAPIDALNDAVAAAEQQLQALRQRQHAEITARWSRYKVGYEHYLHAPEPAEEEPLEQVPIERFPADGGPVPPPPEGPDASSETDAPHPSPATSDTDASDAVASGADAGRPDATGPADEGRGVSDARG